MLMAEVASQPMALGSTVFGYNDAYRRLRPFVLEWRAACAAAGNGGGAMTASPLEALYNASTRLTCFTSYMSAKNA